MFVETTTFDKWAYLVGILFMFVVWGVFYRLRTDLRRQMLLVSVLIVPSAPLGQFFFLKDYWRPPIIFPIVINHFQFGGLVDLCFAFAMGGIAVAAYPVVTQCSQVCNEHPKRRWLLLVFAFAEGGAVIILTSIAHLNSIFSSTIGFLVAATVICVIRRDLLLTSLVSGVIASLVLAGAEGILSFVVPLYLSRYWLLYGQPLGILILHRVPLTEAMWGMAFGLAVGPLYFESEGISFVPHRYQKKQYVHQSIASKQDQGISENS